MPKITEATVTREQLSGICGPAEALLFSDTGGLTQFGAFVEILEPGSRSSLMHWHAMEDEMVYALAGELTVREGAARYPLLPGEAVTFRAGDPAGHFLENTGATPARYLVIGTRAPRDTVTYPEHDRVQWVDRTTGTRSFTTLDGKPADRPG